MARGVITGPMICTACPVPHETRDFYFVVKWPQRGLVECKPSYEARIARETREQLNPQTAGPAKQERS